jgi:hypothetical protein
MTPHEKIKELVENSNSKDYPKITDAIDASIRLLLSATNEYNLNNPEIETVISLDNGAKYLFKFERIDLD